MDNGPTAATTVHTVMPTRGKDYLASLGWMAGSVDVHRAGICGDITSKENQLSMLSRFSPINRQLYVRTCKAQRATIQPMFGVTSSHNQLSMPSPLFIPI